MSALLRAMQELSHAEFVIDTVTDAVAASFQCRRKSLAPGRLRPVTISAPPA